MPTWLEVAEWLEQQRSDWDAELLTPDEARYASWVAHKARIRFEKEQAAQTTLVTPKGAPALEAR